MEMLFVGLLIGLVVGALLAWSWARAAAASAGAATAAELAGTRAERDGLRERVVDLEAAVSDDAQTAAALTPLQAALRRVEAQVETLERDRVDQFATVREALGRVEESTSLVGREAASLAGSLRVSSVRGSWGEVQLRRVLEVAGLMARCDFDDQVSAVTREGVAVRPDVVVALPGGKVLVIDAKAPMSDWLAAQAEGLAPPEQAAALDRHAAALRRHVQSLESKEYWTAFDVTPEMVVCFVPTDATLAAALAKNPGLHEEAMRRKVVLASPSTLLALLRTVAFTWQQDSLTRSAQELLALGTELHARLGTLGGHVTKMGDSLRRSVESYNAMVGTLETRVLVSARRFTDLGIAQDELSRLAPTDAGPRVLTAPELLDAVTAEDGRPEIDLDGLRSDETAPVDPARRHAG